MHRSILRPWIYQLQCKAFVVRALCVSKAGNGKQRVLQALLRPNGEGSGFRILRQRLTLRFLLRRRVQEVTADVEREDEEPAVQVHHHLLL